MELLPTIHHSLKIRTKQDLTRSNTRRHNSFDKKNEMKNKNLTSSSVPDKGGAPEQRSHLTDQLGGGREIKSPRSCFKTSQLPVMVFPAVSPCDFFKKKPLKQSQHHRHFPSVKHYKCSCPLQVIKKIVTLDS